jgi:hypothetical protein
MVRAPTLPPVTFALPTVGDNLLQNPSLERLAADGTTDCWDRWASGVNSATWSPGVPHDGAAAETVTVASWSSGEVGLTSHADFGLCAPSVSPGRSYTLRAWYIAPDASPRFVVRYVDRGAWFVWQTSPPLPPSATYAPAEWTTPPVTAGMTLVSVGLVLAAPGTLTVDDFALTEATP